MTLNNWLDLKICKEIRRRYLVFKLFIIEIIFKYSMNKYCMKNKVELIPASNYRYLRMIFQNMLSNV